MWELDHKEGWVLVNWCFWTVVLEKAFESPLDCKDIKPVNPKEYQSWIFIRRTDTEAPILGPPDAKSRLIRKDPDAGKDWRQEKKGTTEDKIVGWHHRLNGHDFEQALGGGEGQGSLVCCSPWGHKESDTTKQLNNNNIYGLPWLLRVKNLPAMWETWIWSLGWEDPLEKTMTTHFSILAWRTVMDKGAWWASICLVTKSLTWLSD